MDRLPDQLESEARVRHYVDGDLVSARRGFNWPAGTTVTDDPVEERVDLTLATGSGNLGPAVYLTGDPGAPTRGSTTSGSLVWSDASDPNDDYATVTDPPSGLGLTFTLDNMTSEIAATEAGSWLIAGWVTFANTVQDDWLNLDIEGSTNGPALTDRVVSPATPPSTLAALCSGVIYLTETDTFAGIFDCRMAAGTDTVHACGLQITRLT